MEITELITGFFTCPRMTWNLTLGSAYEMAQQNGFKISKDEFKNRIRELVEQKKICISEGNEKLNAPDIDVFGLHINIVPQQGLTNSTFYDRMVVGGELR